MVDVNVDFVLENEEPINAEFIVEPDVTYTADIMLSAASSFHNELSNRDLPDQHPMGAITGLDEALETKVDKTDESSKVYGTDSGGEQTTYDVDSFGQVDDVQVGGVSVVTNKIAELGTMAGETASDYSTKAVADTLYADISYEGTIDNHIADKDNPHEVTKAQVGLGNCDNTSDADKPVSTATQTALNGKVDKTNVASKVYGTDASGNQTTYDKGSFGQVDDVRVGGVSVVTNKIANLGTMAGETASDYPTLDGNNTFTGDNELTGTISATMEGAEGEEQSGLYMDNTGLSIYSEGEYSGVSVYVSPIDGLTVQNAAYGLDYSDTYFIANGYGVTCSSPLGNSDGEVINVGYANNHYATTAQGALADTALQPNDNISELTNNLGYQTATQVANSIAVETNNRELADNGLQSQIDAIVSSSDVFDIVGTYAELQAYDISTVPVNDIIKVLVDNTHAGAATYYRCIETNNVKSWSYIGSEGAYYTKGEADNKFVPQTRTVNNKALSSDITLTAGDVGALPSSTVIPTVNDSTVTIQKNGSTVSTFTLNQSSNETVNITVPTDTSDLTNNAGFITGITSGDVTTALGYTPYNSTNPNGYISEVDWGDVGGDIEDQLDLQSALADKQEKLTAGTDLEIVQGATLPSGYTQLTSITSHTEEWINTGIKLTNNFKAVVVGRVTSTPSGNFRTILGANNNDLATGKQNVIVGWATTGWYIEPCISPSYVYSSLATDTNTHTFTTTVTSTASSINIDGVINTVTATPSITDVNLAIFGRLGKNGTVSSLINFELNSIELYQSGVLVFNGVPAKRNADDVIGLYETVSDTFLTNSGTGTFGAGAEVPADTVINFTNDTGYITGITSGDVTTALGYTPVDPSNLATVATSGDYDDLINKPTIPTINNPTITFTQGGVTKGSITLNQSSSDTIAFDAGGSGGISNDATGTDSITILGTPADADFCINIGEGSEAGSLADGYNGSIAIGVQDNSGTGATATGEYGIAIGTDTSAGSEAVVLGHSANAGDNGVVIGSGASTSDGVAVGNGSSAIATNTVAIGSSSSVNRYAQNAIAIGGTVRGTNNNNNANNAIQIGAGTNTTADTLQIGSYQLLDTSTGFIPEGRVAISQSVKNQNTVAGATNPIYDWVGTLAEYNTQAVETLHPEWICYITDDVSGGSSVYTKTEVNNLLNEKADADLNNINPTQSVKNTIIGWAMPDYNNAVTLTSSDFPYTATKQGIVFISGAASNSNFEMYVDGVKMVSAQAPSSYHGRSGQVIVDVGDIVTYVSTGLVEARFIPFKGA